VDRNGASEFMLNGHGPSRVKSSAPSHFLLKIDLLPITTLLTDRGVRGSSPFRPAFIFVSSLEVKLMAHGMFSP